jgi:MFS family permease
VTFGGIGMIAMLAFLDLAAKACPKQAEGTFFALLMSIYNGGGQGSEIIGGWLYDSLGYTRLILLSAACTSLCWLLVPLVPVEQIEALAAAPDAAEGPPGSRAGIDRTGAYSHRPSRRPHGPGHPPLVSRPSPDHLKCRRDHREYCKRRYTAHLLPSLLSSVCMAEEGDFFTNSSACRYD